MASALFKVMLWIAVTGAVFVLLRAIVFSSL
jgi:hypothetical protein